MNIIVSWKNPIFWWKKVRTGKHPPYCDKIPTKSLCGFGLKNLGLADPPPPQLGQNPKFFQKFHLKAPLKGPLFFCRPPLSVTLTGRDYGVIFSQIIVCLLFSPIIICFTKKTNQRLKIKGCTIRLLSNVGYSPYVTLAGHPTPSTSSPGTLTSAHSNPTPLLNEKGQRQRERLSAEEL